MSGEEETQGFLSRWSRRKREAAEAPPADVAPPAAGPIAPAAAPAVEADSPARPACPIPNLPEIDLESLPRIEELTAESDFSLFLRPGVPALLRNAALRRMWSLDPAIRDFIGPVDYQWDFNTPGGLPFGFSDTLGGDVTKLLAQAIGKIEDLAGEEEEAEPAPAAPALPEPEAPPAPAAEAPQPALGTEEAARPPLAAVPAEEPAPPPRRRHGRALPA